jgi:predicted deacylase
MLRQRRIKIGDVEATPGSKSHGFIKAGELPAADVRVPIYIINGTKPGPTLCVLAGVHSDEWQGMEAAVRIYQYVSPKKLAGSIISCPYQNLPGFQGNANIGDHGVGRPNLGSNPLDGTNMSSSYPGKEDGTISQRMAHVIFNQLVMKADYVMDLHAGDVWEKIVSMSWYWTVGNERVDRESEAMAKCYPTDFIMTSALADRLKPGLFECTRKGIPAVLSEAGSAGLLEESAVNFHFTGVLNVMKHFKMIEGQPEGIKPVQRIFEKLHDVKASFGGFYTCKVDAGQTVMKGDMVGEIKSIFGEPLETLVSPADGCVFVYNTWPPVKSGDLLIRIAEKSRGVPRKRKL